MSTTDERARLLATAIERRALDPGSLTDTEAVGRARNVLATLRSLGLEVVATGDLTAVFRAVHVDGKDAYALAARVSSELSRRYE